MRLYTCQTRIRGYRRRLRVGLNFARAATHTLYVYSCLCDILVRFVCVQRTCEHRVVPGYLGYSDSQLFKVEAKVEAAMSVQVADVDGSVLVMVNNSKGKSSSGADDDIGRSRRCRFGG